jgi:hypothetical protein
VRHTLDVMHCEENICENMLKVIFEEKDYVAIQKYMEEMGIRP